VRTWPESGLTVPKLHLGRGALTDRSLGCKIHMCTHPTCFSGTSKSSFLGTQEVTWNLFSWGQAPRAGPIHQGGIALSISGCGSCPQGAAGNTALNLIPLWCTDHFQAATDVWALVPELPWEGSVWARSGHAVLHLAFLLQG